MECYGQNHIDVVVEMQILILRIKNLKNCLFFPNIAADKL